MLHLTLNVKSIGDFFLLLEIRIIRELDGVAPLMTEPPSTSFTTLNFKKNVYILKGLVTFADFL